MSPLVLVLFIVISVVFSLVAHYISGMGDD